MTNDELEIETLVRVAEASSGSLSRLLLDYGEHLDGAMVTFLGSYMRSLELDAELALTRGSGDDLQLIVEDMRELVTSTAIRLRWLGVAPRGASGGAEG